MQSAATSEYCARGVHSVAASVAGVLRSVVNKTKEVSAHIISSQLPVVWLNYDCIWNDHIYYISGAVPSTS